MPDGDPGIVTCIQTFGNQAANYQPHIHCLAADVLFLSDGGFLSTPLISPVDVTELFRRVVIKAFVKEELITQDVAQNMLSWPHSGFHVHISSRLLPDEGDALKATARYAARAPISLSRLHYDRERQQVTYRYTSAYDHREHTAELSPLDIIAHPYPRSIRTPHPQLWHLRKSSTRGQTGEGTRTWDGHRRRESPSHPPQKTMAATTTARLSRHPHLPHVQDRDEGPRRHHPGRTDPQNPRSPQIEKDRPARRAFCRAGCLKR